MAKTLIAQVAAIASLPLILLLASCATSPVPLGLPCSVGPVVLDKGATSRLTRDEKEQIVALNETGARLCRWKAP